LEGFCLRVWVVVSFPGWSAGVAEAELAAGADAGLVAAGLQPEIYLDASAAGVDRPIQWQSRVKLRRRARWTVIHNKKGSERHTHDRTTCRELIDGILNLDGVCGYRAAVIWLSSLLRFHHLISSASHMSKA